jgi:hypothetical protein
MPQYTPTQNNAKEEKYRKIRTSIQDLCVHDQAKIKIQMYSVLLALNSYARFIRKQKPKVLGRLILHWGEFI